ncbi:uncharacterized protein BP01DRAFT_277779, partial [Aspergillus saccharolyticus JOP 1030-1]
RPPQGTSLARLSLAKFSHVTTTMNHRGPLNWGHIIGNNDLIAIFERSHVTGSMSDGLILKILRFRDIIEELNLSFLAIDAANDPTKTSQTSASKPLFAVVVKLPCLAVKYPRGSMVRIRRFQIKFTVEKDYYAALAILSELNLPFSEAGPAPMRKQ